MAQAGIPCPDPIIADGKLHRYCTDRDNNENCWYAFYPDGVPAGAYGCWKRGLSETWSAKSQEQFSDAERKTWHERMEHAKQERGKKQTEARTNARTRAIEILQNTKPVTDEHPYLQHKGVKSHGIRTDGERLIIPLCDNADVIHSLQFISPTGEKRFLHDGAITGHYAILGKPTGALCIAEGYATAASIHEATGYAVVVAFNAGNLKPVAETLRGKYPEARIIVCADDDYRTEGNPGTTRAREAVQAVNGFLAVPDFGENRPSGATDFNDLHQAQGLEAVGRAVASASALVREVHQPVAGNVAAGDPAGTEWPEPLPLVAKVEPEPYPLDALPDTIRAAVIEVQGFTKAPIAMVASSALAALALAIQAHADVQRADRLTGPVGLFLLTIADSGERKSTCDGFFTAAIQEYQQQQTESAKPEITKHRADIAAWEAKRAGLIEAIKQAARKGCATADAESNLRDLEEKKPEPKRVPKLLRGDDTPENLAWVLSREWPSSGVLSSEAGIVLGAHGMGKDSIMRNLGLLNILWDGGVLSIGRRTSESFTVRGARLTMALQVQEATLRSFFDRSGGLARGTGFLARFLVAWPESTQGFRPFTDPPASWPRLAAFNRRITAILNQPAPIDEAGALTPPLLPLTPEAKAAWVAFHDAIEGELSTGGELYDVRDVASKSADNAARLAALFQIFEGAGGAVGADAFEGASRIAAWHLNEARRFFGELVLPAELAGAARLDTWLIQYCRRERTHLVPIAKLQQGGPGGLRSKTTIETAMRELEEADRARLGRDGKRKVIAVNPALLIEGGVS
jgi:putative DNA primase/helicase